LDTKTQIPLSLVRMRYGGLKVVIASVAWQSIRSPQPSTGPSMDRHVCCAGSRRRDVRLRTGFNLWPRTGRYLRFDI